LEINGWNPLVFAGFLMKVRMLRRLGLRWVVGARISREGSASGFELMLAPSREDPRRYAIESIKRIDRRTALRTLRICGLIAAVLPKSFLAQEERDGDGAGEANAAARIRFVRLTPRQVLSMFDEIRRRDADARELYADLRGKSFDLIGDRARGAVIRAYAADCTVRGEGIVMELPHRRADGAEATFNVSIKDGMTGEARSGEVKADYAIRCGERVDTYEIRDGQAHLVKEPGPR
jgi:hypothetical protein